MKLFFRKFYITGLEHINRDKAQIIACNHPSGFMEPLIMACFFPKDLYFLVRGDVFENPVLKPLLVSTHQIPIYRFKDGFSKLRENSNTVDASSEVLRNKNSLLIFVEGSTKSIRMLRPLQKGMARIANQTLKQYPENPLEIIPVGINFSHPVSPRKDVALSVGAPVSVQLGSTDTLEESKKIQEIWLSEVYEAMKSNVIHFDHQQRVKSAEFILELIWEMLYSINKSKLSGYPGALKSLIEFAKKWDALTDDQFEKWQIKIKSLQQLLKTKKLSSAWLISKNPSFIEWVYISIGFLPAIFGYLFNVIPFIAGVWLTKILVNQKEFKTSILMVSLFGLFSVYYLVWVLLGCWLPELWILSAGGMVTGLLYLKYKDVLQLFRFRNHKELDLQWSKLRNDLAVDFDLQMFN